MTLTEFLLARIAEDEAVAGDPKYDNPPNDMRIEWAEVGGMSEVLCIGEARLRAECEAKRRIVEMHSPIDPCDAHDANFETVPCDTLRHLALPYADHPDYRAEWKP